MSGDLTGLCLYMYSLEKRHVYKTISLMSNTRKDLCATINPSTSKIENYYKYLYKYNVYYNPGAISCVDDNSKYRGWNLNAVSRYGISQCIL